MGLQRLSKDYDIVFSSRQLMFLISESSKPDILGLLNLDCSDEANDVPHLLTEKKHTDDFLLVIFLFWVQKEGRRLAFRNLTVIDMDREPSIHSLCLLLTFVSYYQLPDGSTPHAVMNKAMTI